MVQMSRLHLISVSNDHPVKFVVMILVYSVSVITVSNVSISSYILVYSSSETKSIYLWVCSLKNLWCPSLLLQMRPTGKHVQSLWRGGLFKHHHHHLVGCLGNTILCGQPHSYRSRSFFFTNMISEIRVWASNKHFLLGYDMSVLPSMLLFLKENLIEFAPSMPTHNISRDPRLQGCTCSPACSLSVSLTVTRESWAETWDWILQLLGFYRFIWIYHELWESLANHD